MLIRKVTHADLPYVYEICLKTGNNGKDASSLFFDPYLLGQYYAAPYLFFEGDICFAAVNTDVSFKRPSGYILGTSDSVSFYTWFYSKWIPDVQQIYQKGTAVKSPAEKHMIDLFYETNEAPKNAVLKEYPAHLHIDLLPELQGRGAGKLLMNTFIEALKNKQCKGLHLGVSKENEHAVGFYKSLGFTVLEDNNLSFLLGLKF